MSVFVLPKAHIRRRYSDIRRQMKLMRHVPSVTMGDDNQRLGQPRRRASEWINHVNSFKQRLTTFQQRLESIDVYPSREVVTMPKQNRSPQRRISIVCGK